MNRNVTTPDGIVVESASEATNESRRPTKLIRAGRAEPLITTPFVQTAVRTRSTL
ncbi:MAG: hypothetical protein WKF58_16040 [Ilumatobacteraceae bacterium]